MLDQERRAFELDHETASLVAELAADATDSPSTAALVMIERLRRLEEDARFSGTTRQNLQRILSARRILGDTSNFRRFQGSFLSD